MAKTINRDRAEADMRGPSYRTALSIITGPITKLKNHIQGKNKEIGEQWAKFESFKVHKKAGKIFAMLDKEPEEERLLIMRDLNGLIEAAGWDQTGQDLVDQAQGNVVQMRVGRKDDEEGVGDEEFDSEIEEISGNAPASGDEFYDIANHPEDRDEATEEANKAAAEVREKAASSRRGLAAKAPLPPYTGDNSDLAE